MRNAFMQELIDLAHKHPQIALVTGDIGYSVVEQFSDEFPDRFINAGVAEQNMTSLAAGMASEGYHVFTYSIANFPTFRCAEQIRNDVDYHNLAVTVVAVGGGLGYGALGYSHHAVQDYALMRSFPNMLIAAPGDPKEVRACLRYLVNNPGPSYLRLGKVGEPNFHNALPLRMGPGIWLPIREARSESRRAILSTGATLEIAMEWIKSDEYSDREVYSMPLWSMADKVTQRRRLLEYEEVITLEDHLLDGGFGSWMLEAKSLYTDIQCSIKPVALSPKIFETVGQQKTLNQIGGLFPQKQTINTSP